MQHDLSTTGVRNSVALTVMDHFTRHEMYWKFAREMCGMRTFLDEAFGVPQEQVDFWELLSTHADAVFAILCEDHTSAHADLDRMVASSAVGTSLP